MSDGNRHTMNGSPPAEPTKSPVPVTMPGSFSCTDMGNAERLVARYRDRIRYVAPWKKWLVWDGKKWAPDDVGEIMQLAKATARAIYHEAGHPSLSQGKAQKLAKHAHETESEHRLKAMISLARTESGIPVVPSDLDADPWLLSVANGTIDLRTGQLRPHSRDDLITRALAVEYDPAATCPRWEQFLSEVFVGDAEMVSYIRRAAGYTLTGLVIEQILLFLLGRGANGKSTLLNTLHALLGSLAVQCAPDILLTKRGEAHPTEQAALYGKRLAICTEIEEGRRLAEVTVKQLTGGDPITARRMREDFWTFTPTHKFWIGANHKPIIRGTDHAIWRRIHMIPFDVVFDGQKKDPELPARLAAELPGILTWTVQGCIQWQTEGLRPPERVCAATDAYRAESDSLGTWISERLVTDKRAGSKPKTLYDDYARWCDEQGERPKTLVAFGLSVAERGIEKTGPKGRQLYAGVRLRLPGDSCDTCDSFSVSSHEDTQAFVHMGNVSQLSQASQEVMFKDIERESIQAEHVL